MSAKNVLLVVVVSIICFSVQIKGANYTMDIYLQDPHPTKPDENLWATEWLPEDQTYYIIAYEPLVTKKVAHHLILQRCSSAVEDDDGNLNCGERSPQYLYAWARGAPPLYLPPGVGFKFGKDSEVKAIRLGVHFKDLKNVEGVDMSHIGARITYTDTPQPKEAAVFLLKSSGHIEPNQTERIDVACDVEEDIKLHAFAFRTHSHQLGKVMSGYVVRHHPDDEQMEWVLIGKKNPLLPQFFYPTAEEVLIEKGDTLAARCTMHNFKNHTVKTGQRDEDEMCNFYIMYWAEGGKFPSDDSCGSPGPPEYRWEEDPDLNNIPSDSDKLP